MPIVCGLDSSRFSGQWSKLNKACPGATLHITFVACKEHMLSVGLNIGIASQVWARGIAKKDIPMLFCIAVSQEVDRLSFDHAQDGESFDFAHDHELVEWLVEP